MRESTGQNGPTGEIAAWWRLVELCLPAHESCGAATFQPADGAALEEEWGGWCRTIFHPVLRPAVFALLEAAAAHDIPGIVQCDRHFGQVLPEAAAARSVAAGRKVLLEYVPPAGARLLERLRSAVSDDSSAGHLATAFCVRAHVFHLPAVQTGGALLLAECILGAESAGLTLSASTTASLLQAASEAASEGFSCRALAV